MFIIGYGILAKFGGLNIDVYRKSVPDLEIHYQGPSGIILITVKNKYLRLSDESLIQEIDESRIPTKEEISQIQKIAGVSYIPRLYIFPISSNDKLKIVTFNIAKQVQSNILAGSEEIVVRECQKRYTLYGGWSAPHKDGDHPILSQCTLNAALWLASYSPDLIGLQESGPIYLPGIVDIIKRQTGFQYETIGHGFVQFIYNPILLGKGVLLSPLDLHMVEQGRQMIIVWFSLIKLLAINLHAPHKVDLEKVILDAFNKVPVNVNPNRIIITGDFNDAYNNTPLTQIKIMDKILRQHGPASKSCCTNANYRYMGDYIFDSEYQRPGFYGIPPDAYDKLMSDHHPVIYDDQS